MPKKNRRSNAPRSRDVEYIIEKASEATLFPPALTRVLLPETSGGSRRCEFGPFYGKGCDQIVYAAQRVVEKMAEQSRSSFGKTLSARSIVAYFTNGMRAFLPFCSIMSTALGRELTLKDIDRELIEHFIAHISGERGQVNSLRTKYNSMKSVIAEMQRQGIIEGKIFPKNPFPRSNRVARGEVALSSGERKLVMKALKRDMNRILNGTGNLTSEDLVVCLLAISARTGINPTPLIELHVECLQPHPIKAERYVLVTFKRRGASTHISSMRYSKDVKHIHSALPDVARIVDMVVRRNADIRAESAYPTLLFVFRRRDNSKEARLTVSLTHDYTNAFVNRHGIRDDDERTLKLNVMRLRKTFENKIFEISNQDPFITARLGGHTPKVSNDSYLAAPDESRKNFRVLVEVLTESRLTYIKHSGRSLDATPIGSCRDSLRGEFAPKNGTEHCQKFLACFRCRSFAITADDLYRVYSFYWMIVRERKRIGVKAWSKYYAHIIRIVDHAVATRFESSVVEKFRTLSEFNPHPFWRDPEILEMEL